MQHSTWRHGTQHKAGSCRGKPLHKDSMGRLDSLLSMIPACSLRTGTYRNAGVDADTPASHWLTCRNVCLCVSARQRRQSQLDTLRCDAQLGGGEQGQGVTPALLVQVQQVLPVLRGAKALQKQHPAEVLNCLFYQDSIINCTPATHSHAFSSRGSPLASTSNAAREWLAVVLNLWRLSGCAGTGECALPAIPLSPPKPPMAMLTHTLNQDTQEKGPC